MVLPRASRRNEIFAILLLAAGLLLASFSSQSSAQQTPLKIGVLSDFSSVYSDIGGQGNVEATRMAIEDFGGQMFGTKDLPSYDAGRSGHAERVLHKIGFTTPPSETVLIQAKRPGVKIGRAHV